MRCSEGALGPGPGMLCHNRKRYAQGVWRIENGYAILKRSYRAGETRRSFWDELVLLRLSTIVHVVARLVQDMHTPIGRWRLCRVSRLCRLDCLEACIATA